MKGKFKSFVLMAFCLLTCKSEGFAREIPINRHFIIVVDQTIKSTNSNMGVIYRNLCSWLKGEHVSGLNMQASVIPENQKFDLGNDAISLYAFGLSGDGHKMNSSYGKIHSLCSAGTKSDEDIFNIISASLIHRRNRYVDGNCIFSADGSVVSESLNDFLSIRLRKLFNSTDDLHSAIGKNSGITMSHFVYPLIMQYVSKVETANEYYLILVSDFKSGLYSNNDEDDWKTLTNMTAGNHKVRTYFEKQVNIMRQPFVQADYLHFQAGDIGARGTRLIHKSVALKSQLYINRSTGLSQSNGNFFKLAKTQIVFDKDSLTTIDSIGVAMFEKGQLICYRTILRGDSEANEILTENRVYQIPAQSNLNLGKSLLDDVTVKYIFYTMSHDSQGNDVLPVSLISQQVINKNSITYINEQLRRNMTIAMIILIAIVVIAIMIWRGLKKDIEVTISRFAQKYVDVTKDKGAVELPCWFYKKGDDAAKLLVRGNVKTCKTFSVGGTKKLYVRLQEMKPEGFSYWINGKKANNFISVDLANNGNFEFYLDINIDTAVVDINKLNTCSVMIDFRVDTSLFGKLLHTDDGIGNIVFDFYFIEDLGRAWVGFDPGTSGSCVAIGNPNGALNDPNIEMVTIQQGNEMTDIIPSKLIFDKDLKNKDVESLCPGRDYQYGMEAERNWNAARNMPRFQSIKKLLGYKKSEADKIEIHTNSGEPLRISGVDMAHLLVKGLDYDFRIYLSKLSKSNRLRIVGDQEMPQRAVVAIPNNYTLPKIQDMVESIRRLGTFKEVRYIYEAEGILFNYLRKTFREKHPACENIVVYDMGGATINLSVFQIKYVSRNNSTYYEITTLGRIGYAVGGDNIDVALMEHIFAMKALPEKERHEYQKKHKTEILADILRLKKNLIHAFQILPSIQMEGIRDKLVKGLGQKVHIPQQQTDVDKMDVIYDSISFGKFVNKLLGDLGNVELEGYPTDTNMFIEKITKELLVSKELDYFVLSKVRDAVNEIKKYPEVAALSSIDKLIFAGRSTMFPRIRQTVATTLGKRGNVKNIKILDGLFDNSEIKTSVAYGACWYGVYNGLISLDNSRLSSAYGFKQTTGNDSKLNILLNQNSTFGEDNTVSRVENVVSNFDGDGQTVAFYQVMGSGVDDDLLAERNRYKVNYLTSIPVTQTTQSVGIMVGRNNTATCCVTFDTGITTTKSDVDIETRDITEENDWAYIFATTDEEKTVVQGGASRSSSNQKSYNSQKLGKQDGGNQNKWYEQGNYRPRRM